MISVTLYVYHQQFLCVIKAVFIQPFTQKHQFTVSNKPVSPQLFYIHPSLDIYILCLCQVVVIAHSKTELVFLQLLAVVGVEVAHNLQDWTMSLQKCSGSGMVWQILPQ